jgi:hypothetical protein
MKKNLICKSVYDLRTLRFLLNLGISSFSFDLSPKSSNFVPEFTLFNSLLPELTNGEEVFFHFENFDAIMITRLLKKIEEINNKRFNYYLDIKNLDCNFHNQISSSFFIDHSQYDKLSKFKNVPSGLVIDYAFLDKLLFNNFSNFVSNFHFRNSSFLNNANRLVCDFNFYDSIKYNLLDYFDFTDYSININPNLEICYRNVDLKLLSEGIRILREKVINN